MSLEINQYSKLVEDTLKSIDLYSINAYNLVRGTCAQESAFGKYRRQLGGGPALGIYQIEPATFNWLLSYLNSKPNLRDKIFSTIGKTKPVPEDMVNNDVLSTIICRLRYYVVPEELPSNLEGYAAYWKKYYNTVYGAGTEEEFINNYKLYLCQQ